MTYQGIDTVARISARAAKILRSEGVDFAVRYLVPQSGSTAWKALSASEAADIRGAGLALMLVWETAATRVKGGAEAGSIDGAKVKELAQKMSVPVGTAVYFACDFDIQEDELFEAEAYYRAARIASSPYQVGIYGGERIITALADAFSYLWQCVAWSNEFHAPIIQYEWQHGESAKALAGKVGFAVDLDSAETLAGMWAAIRPSTEAEDAHRWAVECGIVDEGTNGAEQLEIMLYRYHRAFSAEDEKSVSGLLT